MRTGSTMRFCGTFWGVLDLARTENRAKLHRLPGQSLHPALLAVDHTDRRVHDETGVANRRNGVEERPAGGDHVLDEADELAVLVSAFEAIRGAVLLRRLAHDHERQAGGKRAGGCKRDGTELRSREPRGLRLELRDGAGDPIAQSREQVRPGLEAVLVEVVARAPARAKEEVPFEQGVLAKGERELVVGQVPRALPRISRASGRRRSAPGEPFVRESIDPSSK